MDNTTAANENSENRDVDTAIGATLRSLRESQALNARQLAEISGISAAMISRIENAQVSPSIATMTALTRALNVPLVTLFRNTSVELADYTLTRQGEGVVSTRLHGDHIHHFINLASHRRRDLIFESHLITLKKQEAPPPHYVAHGVIFLHVLSGSAHYQYGRQELTLNKGDSLSIDAELSHGVNKLLSDEFIFLSVQAECR